MGGDNEGWLLPNGLLPNEGASVVRVLDPERWLKAEERTAELIKCIQPNKPSEDRRNAVANYVQRLIMQCFPCQVFTFGSVPLKTYLPDGDIDLTAFSKNQNLKDMWAHRVRDMLENEEKNENAEFRVKEVQYIQAEVKIIKCLVENIVVDISFNQLGGLCTLCFLEEVDNLISQDHLFKRSIILIKAWCYYESRILGAHHGLISTYALETLVLYIFHVFNNSFAGPLEVLYRFLEFFSKFDWENFCVSLWGPVPISLLPDVTAEPPRKDGGELLLSKLFLEACSTVYAVFPSGQENPGQPFTSKHFNVIDPLRVNNNLGRSVSKGNFFRIRSAFAFGAKRLARLLDCPKEDLYNEVNQFFFNTWDRHGSGHRPDAPKNDLWRLRLSSPEQLYKAEDVKNQSSSGTSGHEADSDVIHGSRSVPSRRGNRSSESTSKSSEGSVVSHSQNRRSYTSSNNTRHSEQNRKNTASNQVTQVDRSQRSSKAEHMVNDLQGRYLFARTQSSPELTDTYGEAFSQGNRNRASDSGKGHVSSALDQNRLKMYADNSVSQGSRLPIDDPSSVRQTSPRQNLDSPGDSSNASNANYSDSGLHAISEESTSGFGMEDLHQEEQDFINMMASSAAIGYGGQVHLPLNIAPLAYAHRNFGGMVPSNIPMMDIPWGNNIQFPHSLVSPQFAHYFPQMGLAANSQDAVESINEDFSSSEVHARVVDNEFWHEQERSSSSGFVLNNGSFEIHQLDDMQPSSSSGYDFDHSSQLGGPGNSLKVQEKFSTEARGSLMEDHVDSWQYHGNRETEVPFDDRNAISRPYVGSDREKASLESSWEGSHAKGPKSVREKRGRKPAAIPVPYALHGKGKNISDHSSQEDDDKDRNSLSNSGLEMVGPQQASSLHISRHQVPGSESVVPMTPVLLAPDTRGTKDNSEVPPVTFYATGPPVPFLMVPLCNFPNESGTPDASTSQFIGEEGLDKLDSSPAYISSEIADQSESLSSSSLRATVELMDHKPDILNGDFLSHWKNLQYGRFCQNPQNPEPLHYPSPFIVPPVYVQGRFPWDGLGRPLSTNMNLFNELVSHGSPLVPVAPLQTVSNGPNVYPHYADEIPRYRGGTGTYLPNPKMSVRDRQPTNSRKGNYNHDKSDNNHGDREGNWNSNSKTRTGGRNHGRNQAEKSSPRPDRLANESRADRSRSSHRNEEFSSYQSLNGPIRSNMSNSGSVNVPYGLYPLSSANPGGVSSNGPTIPSVVMLYPYDHAPGYGSAEQFEYGTLGPAGFSEVSHINEGTRVNVGFDDQRIHSNSAQMPSPDQPSSPHFQR